MRQITSIFMKTSVGIISFFHGNKLIITICKRKTFTKSTTTWIIWNFSIIYWVPSFIVMWGFSWMAAKNVHQSLSLIKRKTLENNYKKKNTKKVVSLFNWQNLLVIWLFDGFCLFDGVEQQIICNLSRLGDFLSGFQWSLSRFEKKPTNRRTIKQAVSRRQRAETAKIPLISANCLDCLNCFDCLAIPIWLRTYNQRWPANKAWQRGCIHLQRSN